MVPKLGVDPIIEDSIRNLLKEPKPKAREGQIRGISEFHEKSPTCGSSYAMTTYPLLIIRGSLKSRELLLLRKTTGSSRLESVQVV